MYSLNVNENDKILIVAPHPDDECIGCGGVLYKYRDKCSVWVLTDGRYGGKDGDEAKLIEFRKSEFEKEMAFLNITDYRMFGWEDGKLGTIDSLPDENKLKDYSKIFVPNKEDIHPDHVTTYKLVRKAIDITHTECGLYQYEISSPLRKCNEYIDITDIIWTKLHMISFHESQMREFDYCEMARSLNRFRGVLSPQRDGYAECYYSENISF